MRVVKPEPLMLGEDGEPTNAPHTAYKWEPWKVLVVDQATNKRRSKKYFSYKEAKAKAKELQEKFGDTATVGVVSRQIGYGPPESKVSNRRLLKANEQGKFWCAYCRTFRSFHYMLMWEATGCEFCLMPEFDFHIRKCNPIFWDPVNFKMEFGA